MTDPDVLKARREAMHEPIFKPNDSTQLEFRAPIALEFIAVELGRIRMTLDEINARQKAQTGR